MEHVDDDFGDLYAEVEVQASSAINGVPGFSESQIENEENVGKEKGKAEGSEKVSIQEKEDSGSDSDDDDDLKIVLNSDDDEGLGFQISARDANPRSGLGLEDEYDDQDREGVGGGKVVGLEGQGENVEQSLNGGVGERGNGVKPGFHSQYSQYKYIRSQSTAYASNLKGNGCAAAASSFYSTGRSEWEDNGFGKRMGPSSLLPKGGHNFSLPRSRTILDVNIDIFEQKPWKNPGADITDYFNFGLNEDSWKIYCNQVDEYRHKAATPTKPLAPESFQLTEAYEVGGDDEMVTKEGGIGERIHNRCMQPVPSMTSEMTKGRAIQVEDSIVERISSMDIVRPLVRDSDVIHITVQDSMEHSSGSFREGLENSIQKVSPNGDVGLDEEGEFLCFSSASEDELQSESLDGNHEAMELSVPKRSKRITTDDPVPVNCEGDESHQICGVERHHWQEAPASGSDGPNEEIEILNNTKERISEDTCTMDPSVLEAESSAGKRGYAGHCKAYKDCDYIDNGDSCSHTRRRSTKSATECRKSVKSDYYHLKDSNLSHLKRNPNDSRYHTRHRSTAHHIYRSHSGSKLQAHFENECSFSRLDTEEIYDAHLSPVGHGGRNDVPHAFDYCHRENRSYYKESELSSDYHGERFSDYEIGGDCTRGLHKKGHWSSRKMDRHFFRDSDEEEYFHEQRRFFMKEELMVKDWCQYENESPREKYAPYSEDKISGWKRKEDGPHFRKSVKSGDFFLDYRHTDDIQQGKYRRSLTYAEREKDYVELQYGGHEAYAGRKVESPGRNQRRFGSPSDNYWSAGDEDDYLRYRDGKALTSRSFKEPCPTNNSRRRGNMMSVNHVYEKRGKCMRQWSKRIRNTVSFGSYSDVFDTEEDALSADMKFRRKHHWHAELQWNEDKIISRRRDGETHIEGTIYSLDNTPMHKSRHGFNHMVEPIDGHHVDGYGYRQIRKGNSFNKFDRTSNGIHRGSHEQPFLRYGETVDSQLVVGEPKSPHRYYDKHEKIGWSINEERAWRDFDASQPEKITQAEPDFEAHEKDEEWLDKLKPQTNEALDIEEGQIMIEELPSGPTENMYKSDTVAQSRNVKALPNGNGKMGGTVEEYEDSRILQVMAKMERRRERFKEPITLSKEKEMDNAAKVTVDLENRTPVSNHQRPVRKRRWRDS